MSNERDLKFSKSLFEFEKEKINCKEFKRRFQEDVFDDLKDRYVLYVETGNTINPNLLSSLLEDLHIILGMWHQFRKRNFLTQVYDSEIPHYYDLDKYHRMVNLLEGIRREFSELTTWYEKVLNLLKEELIPCPFSNFADYSDGTTYYIDLGYPVLISPFALKYHITRMLEGESGKSDKADKLFEFVTNLRGLIGSIEILEKNVFIFPEYLSFLRTQKDQAQILFETYMIQYNLLNGTFEIDKYFEGTRFLFKWDENIEDKLENLFDTLVQNDMLSSSLEDWSIAFSGQKLSELKNILVWKDLNIQHVANTQTLYSLIKYLHENRYVHIPEGASLKKMIQKVFVSQNHFGERSQIGTLRETDTSKSRIKELLEELLPENPLN